jgi:hypothetical protein
MRYPTTAASRKTLGAREPEIQIAKNSNHTLLLAVH